MPAPTTHIAIIPSLLNAGGPVSVPAAPASESVVTLASDILASRALKTIYYLYQLIYET